MLFCDLVGSTALSTRLDPEDLPAMIGAYHRCVTAVIERAGGFVAKWATGCSPISAIRGPTSTTPSGRCGPGWRWSRRWLGSTPRRRPPLPALGDQPAANLLRRRAAPVPRARLSLGIGGIVNEPRLAIAGEHRLDRRRRLPQPIALGGQPAPQTAQQHPPQILSRARVTPEIAERPALDQLRPDVAIRHAADRGSLPGN